MCRLHLLGLIHDFSGLRDALHAKERKADGVWGRSADPARQLRQGQAGYATAHLPVGCNKLLSRPLPSAGRLLRGMLCRHALLCGAAPADNRGVGLPAAASV